MSWQRRTAEAEKATSSATAELSRFRGHHVVELARAMEPEARAIAADLEAGIADLQQRIRDYANIINRCGNLLSQARGLRPQEELPYSLMGDHLEQLGRQLGRACGTVRAPLPRSLVPSREEGRPQRREQNAAGDWVPLGEIERAEWVRLEREQRAAQDEEKRLRHQEALANARFERPAPEPTHPAERIAQMVEGVLRHR